MVKIEQLRGEIRTAVLQGIGAIMRDPLRKSTPLNLDAIDSFSTAHNILLELEEFVKKLDNVKGKISLEELSAKIQQVIQAYTSSLAEIEQALKIHGIPHDPLTAKNLGLTVRKLLRKVDSNTTDSPPTVKRQLAKPVPKASDQKIRQDQLNAQQTSISEFLKEHENDDNGDETFATSIRDWYSF